MQKIIVPLSSRSYTIHIGSGLLDSLGQYVREALGEITVAVVTDDNVAPLYLSRAVKSLLAAGLKVKSITLPHGEETKSLARLSDLYDFL
ncbi:MAG: 3-dehydroquinate synthase, partial [Clostridia bacterium]|nr:3-dehydroquinate synthase [Clostridia bacterium]